MVNIPGTHPMTGIDWQGQGYGSVRYGEDNQLTVNFYDKSVRNALKSRDQGMPIHDLIPHVRVQTPGEHLNVVDRPIQEQDKMRWPRQYDAYLHNQTQIPEGSPIDLMFVNNPHIADNLRGHGIHTIQQLANLSAHALLQVGMGAQEYQNKAKAYLDSASKGVDFHRIVKENEDLKNQTQVLTNQVQQLQAQLNGFISQMRPGNSVIDPQWQPGYDAQAERLNANHPTKELAKKRGRYAKAEPSSGELEQQQIINEINAEHNATT